jgi:hypothetical protein
VESALQTYLARLEPELATPSDAVLTELDAAVRRAGPELTSAVSYGLLMYFVGKDRKHWVCALNATRRGVCLRFLYGVIMDDPLGVLRPGTSTLMTWDIAADTEPDVAAVEQYVAQAVALHPDFVARSAEISAAAKAAAARPGTGRARPRRP